MGEGKVTMKCSSLLPRELPVVIPLGLVVRGLFVREARHKGGEDEGEIQRLHWPGYFPPRHHSIPLRGEENGSSNRSSKLQTTIHLLKNFCLLCEGGGQDPDRQTWTRQSPAKVQST